MYKHRTAVSWQRQHPIANSHTLTQGHQPQSIPELQLI